MNSRNQIFIRYFRDITQKQRQDNADKNDNYFVDDSIQNKNIIVYL